MSRLGGGSVVLSEWWGKKVDCLVVEWAVERSERLRLDDRQLVVVHEPAGTPPSLVSSC